jgi:membrane protease YdiL (CAAX protease family)
MKPNLFIEAARAGRTDFWRYILTILLAGAFALGGGVVVVLVVLLFTGRLDLAALPPALSLALNLLPFFLILGVLAAALPLLHERPFFSLVNPLAGRFQWRRFFLSAGLWVLLSAASDVFLALLEPGNYVFVFEPERLLPFAVVALLLIPFQAAAEELLFRGYLAQGFGLAGGFWMAWLVPSLLFGLLHGANPEVSAYGALLTLPLYIITGLLLGWVTLRSESLELALGLHVANNLYGTLLVTFPSSALPSPALFRIQAYDPLLVLVVFLVLAVVYLLLLHRLGRAFFR